MFSTFLKIAGRHILRNKFYTAINITGLSLGICACIAIYTITHYELSFDKHHPGAGSIYRVMADLTESTGDVLHFGRVSPQVAAIGREALSGVETIAAVIPFNATVTVKEQPSVKFESSLPGSPYRTTALTEPGYFNIFSYKWLAGNKQQALNEPNAVVLTRKRAQQYFGSSSLHDIIGRQVIYNDTIQTKVTGIVDDAAHNTDLLFSDFISYSTYKNNTASWDQRSLSAWTFVKLKPGISTESFNTQLNSLAKGHAGKDVKVLLKLEPLALMHFNADIIENPIRTAHLPTLYTLMAVAVFILLLAIVNFINLSTAVSAQRVKEVCVRKILGSNRRSLIVQFMTETVLLTLLSVIIAAILAQPVLTVFRAFIPPDASFKIFEGSTIFFLLLVTLVTSALAGMYPARVIAAQLPILGLKGNSMQPGTEKWWLRKGLIVFQFSISLIFIIGSIVITKQLAYTREKDLGFTYRNIITIESPRGEQPSKITLLARELNQIHGVQQVARQWLSPMSNNPRGMKLKFKNTDARDFWVTQVAGDENFIPLYNIRLLAGRNLEPADSVKELVITESLSKMIGDDDPHASLNKILYWNDQPYPVVGVVADFHTASLHDPVTPLCIINRPDREGALAVKLDMRKHTLTQIETAWKKIYPAIPFSFRFYDESLAQLYEKDRQTATLIDTSMGVTIFISCIGLFGLALFTARKRAKEICIRKVLGAGTGHIVVMLGKEFIMLVVIAILIAAPVAWYFMTEWLQGFSYHIAVDGWMIVLAGLIAIVFAILTVGFRAARAAMVNPVEDLRGE